MSTSRFQLAFCIPVLPLMNACIHETLKVAAEQELFSRIFDEYDLNANNQDTAKLM